jgi:adenylate kinase
MVGDREVVGLLLRRTAAPEYRDGVILDGFPAHQGAGRVPQAPRRRKMHGLRREFYGTPLSIHFRQPTIHIMVLFVDEKESVARQLKRGRKPNCTTRRSAAPASATCMEDRPTDHDEGLARRRYRVFKEQTWDALQSLKEIFHYHFINAQGRSTRSSRTSSRSSKYQSTLELDPHGRPPAQRARGQRDHRPRPPGTGQTPRRLRTRAHRSSSPRVVTFIERRSCRSCCATRSPASRTSTPRTRAPRRPLALAMLIDVFSERGYPCRGRSPPHRGPRACSTSRPASSRAGEEGLPHPDPLPRLGNPPRLIRLSATAPGRDLRLGGRPTAVALPPYS